MSAISSLTVFAGTDGWTVRTTAEVTAIVTASKFLNGS
jgi:hypothetical protein